MLNSSIFNFIAVENYPIDPADVAAFYSVYLFKSNTTPDQERFKELLFELFLFKKNILSCKTKNLSFGS